MGAWDVGPFQNDDALDWLGTFFRTPGLVAAEAAFQAIPSEDSHYLDAGVASECVAAAEVVAALRGRPGPRLPRVLLTWSLLSRWRGLAKPEICAAARRAIQRIAANSELRDLWLESPSRNEWQAGMDDLVIRLS